MRYKAIFFLAVMLGCLFQAVGVFAQGGGDVSTSDVGNPGNDGYVGFHCEPPLVCPTPAPIRFDADTGELEEIITGVENTREFFEGTISQTMALSETMSTVIVAGDSITASTVPVDYAPALPRAVAQIGWQFETMGSDMQKRYSLSEWLTKILMPILVVPVKFVKGIFVLGRYLGPLGLFLAWLIPMSIFVAWMKVAMFIRDILIKVFNLFVEAAKFVISVIKLIPFI